MAARIEVLTGSAVGRVLPEVARLRMTVFRDWPYIYDGTLANEQEYLADFAREPDAVVVAAFDGGDVVGAATASPLGGHSAEFVPLFAAAGFDPDRVFYLGESVLLPQWRGRGLGHKFFDGREAHARARRCRSGAAYSHAAFCAVVRAPDDSRKPTGYVPLDAFWTKRGYAKVPGLVGSFSWTEVGATAETAQPMQFWMRPL